LIGYRAELRQFWSSMRSAFRFESFPTIRTNPENRMVETLRARRTHKEREETELTCADDIHPSGDIKRSKLVSDFLTSIIPCGTCLPEAEGFTAISRLAHFRLPLFPTASSAIERGTSDIAGSRLPLRRPRSGSLQRFSFVWDDDRCDERAGTPSGVQTRLFGTRGVARASLNPGLLAEIPSGCETETKSGSNLKLKPHPSAIEVRIANLDNAV